MRRLMLVLCVVCVFFATSITSISYADRANGVLSSDRVVNLPNDQGKWYISVVGDARDAQYQTILKWFSQDPALRKLKNQVHFCSVTSSAAIYNARYAANVKGLPTVRFQNNQGVVIYEAAGKNLPFTSQGLYGAIADSTAGVQRRPILPWRQNRRTRPLCPSPSPAPSPTPDLDPAPQPIDDGGAPVLEPVLDPIEEEESLPPIWLMLVTLITTAGIGVAVEWRAIYSKK